MDNAIYASLTRQSGLAREMQVLANNLANADTTGFRREGVVFAEHLDALGPGSKGGTLSMAEARGRIVDLRQAVLSQTGGQYDLGIEGDGFFMLAAPDGNRLTRAGAFMPGPDGQLVDADGNRVLDDGGAPIVVPQGLGPVAIGPDGTVSAGGEPVARIGVYRVEDPATLQHRGGTLFEATGAVRPSENARIRQGFLEASNVDPVFEVSRLVEIQRNYELSQSLLDREDQRIRGAIASLTR